MNASIKEETVFNVMFGYRNLGRFNRAELVELRTIIDAKLREEATAYKWERIVITVCRVCGVERKALSGKTRPAQVAFARQLAMSLIYDHTGLSLNEVGKLFGDRDHGTVLHAKRVVEGRRNTTDHGQLIRSVEAALAAKTSEPAAAFTDGSASVAT